MITVDVILDDSFFRKTDSSLYLKLAEKLVDELSKDMYNNIQKEGVGVAGGQEPSGGAPVWQGDPSQTTYYPGYLKEHHQLNNIGLYERTITSSAWYTRFVIYGHGSVRPNPYPKRAVDNTLRKNITKKIANEFMVANGLK